MVKIPIARNQQLYPHQSLFLSKRNHMIIGDIIQYLEQVAPPQLQESYDNSRLIVGDKNWVCTGALLTLDSTETIVDEAIEEGCNLIIAHHPIVFSGLKSITGKNYIERTVIKAIKNDIAIYACHTNLDHIKKGVNKKFGERIGLKNLSILAPKKQLIKKLFTYSPIDHAESVRQALFDAGAGHIGNYSECSFSSEGIGSFNGNDQTIPFVGKQGARHNEKEVKIEIVFPSYLEQAILSALRKAHPYETVAYEVNMTDNIHQDVGAGMVGELEEPMKAIDFLKHLKKVMKTDCIRYTTLSHSIIQKVAICGGAGSFLLEDAKHSGAQIFITGDYKYHQFFDADSEIIIADIGHYESEQFTPELIYDILSQNFNNFALRLSKRKTNPINYL